MRRSRRETGPACADPGIFVREGGGVQVQMTIKAFCFLFLVLSLSQMVNSKETIIFHGPGEGPTFSGGGGGPIAYSL